MGKWTNMGDAEFAQTYEEATRAGEAAAEHAAVGVNYDQKSNRIVLYLKRGVTILLDPAVLDELKEATPNELDQVELHPGGLGLSWPNLDVDINVPGLLLELIGTGPILSEVGKRAHGKSSQAKAAASRANGAKGGRPRKKVM